MTPEFWIVAERDTVLKKSTKPSTQLPETDKRVVGEGTKYPVKSYSQLPGQHWRVELEDDTWTIFDGQDGASHWRLSWEDDTGEEEIKPPLLVKSTVSFKSTVGDRLKPDMPFTTRITPHVTYGEFALHEEARRFDYDHQCVTAWHLAVFLEQVRDEFNGENFLQENPLIITSGYRPPKINRKVGGAARSEHLFIAPLTGAVDFYIKNVSVHDVERYCLDHWNGSIGRGAYKGFVHLGMRGAKDRRIVWGY